MEETKGMSLFAYIIAFVIIVWVISAITGGCGFGNGWGFNRGGCGNWGGDNLFENYKATIDAQKTEIINTATTQYQVEQQAAATRELVNAQSNMLATKIDFYEYQNLRDAVSERDRKILQLENQIYNDAKFNALSAQISRIDYEMLKQPRISGVGVACPNSAILNGLGVNSLNNSCGCGCNGTVV